MQLRFLRRVDHELAAVARERVAKLGASGAGRGCGPSAEPTPRLGGWVPHVPDVSALGQSADETTGRHARRPPAPELVAGPVADRLPLALRALCGCWAPQLARCRMELGRGQFTVVVVVLVIGLAIAATMYALGRPEPVPVGAEIVSTGTPPPSSPDHSAGTAGTAGTDDDGMPDQAGSSAQDGPSSPADLVVHVAGKVKSPGVISLPAGSRVVDAIDAAGGVDGDVDLTPLNLARVLADGEQVRVGVEPEPGLAPPKAGDGGTSGPAGAPLNLNTASGQELESLPGIGPALAQRVVAWRAEHTRFASVDELLEVSGIGPSTFADLEPLVTV